LRIDKSKMVGIEAANGAPLYVRVAASLRARISAGEWQATEKVPPFTTLAREYGVATITIRTAMNLLRSDGFVTSVRGIGTRVIEREESTQDNLRNVISNDLVLPPDHSIRVLNRETVSVPPLSLTKSYSPAKKYMHIFKVHSFRREPYAVINIFIDKRIYSRLPAKSDEINTIAYLMHRSGKTNILSSRHEISLSHADPSLAEILQCSLAMQLVRVRHWKLDSSGALVYAAIAMYRPDLFVWDVTLTDGDNHFRHNVRRAPDTR
jgi:GntR family transcriptional regulator